MSKKVFFILFTFLLISLMAGLGIAGENNYSNPYEQLDISSAKPATVVNTSFINLTEPDINGHYDFVEIKYSTHKAHYGRLTIETTPYIKSNGFTFMGLSLWGAYNTSEFNYSPEIENNTITTQNSIGNIEIENSFFENIVKENITLNTPVDEIGYYYDLSLLDWTTKEHYNVFNNTTGENETLYREVTTYGNESITDISLDSFGNAVININGAETAVLPKPFAVDKNKNKYSLDWEFDKENRIIKIAGLSNISDSVYPLVVDPTELVTNGGFETGSFSGWTLTNTSGSDWTLRNSPGYWPVHTGNYSALGYLYPQIGYKNLSQSINFNSVQNISFYFKSIQTNHYEGSDYTGYGFSRFSIDDTPVWTVAGYPDYSASETGPWYFKNYSYNGSGTHTIKFTAWMYSYQPSSQEFMLDDVSIAGTSVLTPVANFYANTTTGTAPKTIAFTDTSTNTPTSWSWNFGDGSTSTSQNPSHTYNANGSYQVSLTATNAGGSDTKTRPNYINIGDYSANIGNTGSPYTMFSGTPRIGIVPFDVTFTNQGSNYTGSLWTFYDGTTAATTNAVHTYSTAGYYYVSLNNTNSAGYNNLTAFNYIWAFDPVTSAFTANKTSIAAGESVLLTDTSSGVPDTWKWCINGALVSTAANIIYQFPSSGVYSIQHYAYNSLDSSGDWENKTSYIYVSDASTTCDFTANVTFGNAPLTVLLTDMSTGTPSAWTWGINGVYQANTQDMTVTFNNPGIYSINHTATNAIGTGTKTKSNYVQVYNVNYGGVYGYIYDAETNNPLSNVNSQLTNSTAAASILSDSSGYYYFWPVWNGNYTLTVSKNGYTTGTLPNLIISGNTLRQDIYLTPSGDSVNNSNISNYSSNWLTYSLSTSETNKSIILTYAITNGTAAYSNFTIYNDAGIVYSSNVSTNTGTFSFTGVPNTNYLVSFDVMNSLGNRYSGAYPILFYRGLSSGWHVFPPDMPQGIQNGIIVLLALFCMMLFGKLFIEIGMILGTAVLASSYIWGYLNLPNSIQTPVIIFLSALIAGGEYIAKKKILG